MARFMATTVTFDGTVERAAVDAPADSYEVKM